MLYTGEYMKRVVGPAGYTIVETMIFLGVSAVLFMSASALISGRQRKTQFATTVREFSTKLESIYGNVGSGYYNSTGKVKCDVSGLPPNQTINVTSSGGNDQGTNGKCVYLGQVLVSPQANASDFQIISLVGLRVTGTPAREVQNLKEAIPRLYTDTAETYSLAGAEFVSVKIDNSTPVGAGSNSAVAFIGSFASYKKVSGVNLSLESGSSHTDVYPVPSGLNGGIESFLASDPSTSNPKNITYCLTNGDQNALVTLTGGTTSYEIGDTSLCRP